jgi:hypothetical protein
VKFPGKIQLAAIIGALTGLQARGVLLSAFVFFKTRTDAPAGYFTVARGSGDNPRRETQLIGGAGIECAEDQGALQTGSIIPVSFPWPSPRRPTW